MSSSATSTPSKGGRSKYANDEERKAAARERQRIYAAKKRAEAKEAKLRALDGSPDDTGKTPKKGAATAVDVGPTPKKRGPKKHEDGLEVNGVDNVVHSFSFSDDLTAADFLPGHITSDHILVPPQPTPSSQLSSFSSGGPTQDYAVIHIPGNPGLISYYATYLPSLSYHLSDCYLPDSRFTVFGASLGGFDVNKRDKYYSLREQTDRQVEIIEHLLASHPSVKIILTGHSVGAYLLLEALRVLKERGNADRIIGGIGLFPALTHIGRSSSGRKVAPLVNVPGLLPFFALLANLLVAIIPAVVWGWLVSIVLRRFTKPARETTVSFLKSPTGIRQALFMGKDEILTIKDDLWDDAIWESNTELVFYFGQQDHWVFDEARDKLIQERPGAKMLICSEGTPHSFCINHSEAMAEKTARWVEDMVVHDRVKM